MNIDRGNYSNFTRFLIGTFILLMVFLTRIVQAEEVLKLEESANNKNQIFVVTNRMLVQSGHTQLSFNAKLDDNNNHHYILAKLSGDQWSYDPKQSLNDLMDIETTYTNWLVFVHGDGKTLQAAVQRAHEIQKIHKVNVLVYAWPSMDKEVGAIKNFKTSYKKVENSASMFSDFLVELEKYRITRDPLYDHNLSLFFHSLGNYYLENIAVEGLVDKLESVFIDNLIVNAAAVEQKDHHVWLEKIIFSERIFVNSNDDDLSLSGLRVFTKLGRQLGESANPPYAQNATYVDFTELVGFPGMGPSHSYYFAEKTMKNEKVKNYYSTIFHGLEPTQFSKEPLILSANLND